MLPGPQEVRLPLPNIPFSLLVLAITGMVCDLELGDSLKGRGNRLQYFRLHHQKIDIISTLTPLIVSGVELRKL